MHLLNMSLYMWYPPLLPTLCLLFPKWDILSSHLDPNTEKF